MRIITPQNARTPDEKILVDDQDFGPLMINPKWWISPKGYAWTKINGKYVRMNRYIVSKLMGIKIPPGYHVHHPDDNKRNNQRYNLQVISPEEHSRIPTRTTKSGVVGIHKRGRLWRAQITIDGEPVSKSFTSCDDAKFWRESWESWIERQRERKEFVQSAYRDLEEMSQHPDANPERLAEIRARILELEFVNARLEVSTRPTG
jgi:hypothetical protein